MAYAFQNEFSSWTINQLEEALWEQKKEATDIFKSIHINMNEIKTSTNQIEAFIVSLRKGPYRDPLWAIGAGRVKGRQSYNSEPELTEKILKAAKFLDYFIKSSEKKRAKHFKLMWDILRMETQLRHLLSLAHPMGEPNIFVQWLIDFLPEENIEDED